MNDRRARKTAIIIVVVTGLLISLVATERITRPNLRHVDPDRSRYPVVGLDLSSHNGVPDFSLIADAGIDFVYLKASEGVDFKDPSFARNYVAARDAGLPVGAYHFFRFDSDGLSQAKNLLESIRGCRLDLPVAIDIEEYGNPASISTEIIRSRLEAMVAYLRGKGREVIFYTNKNGEARFLRGHYEHDSEPELWICSFTDPPVSRREWRLWQHSHISKVPGVKGEVDMNTFNGNRNMWAKWLEKQRSLQPAQ